MQLQIITLVILIGAAIADITNYDGYKVYRVTPQTTEHGELLKIFEANVDYDFWNELRKPGFWTDIMVKPEAQEYFESFLQYNQIPNEILIQDVERAFATERLKQQRAPRVAQGRISFDQYHRYDAIVSYLTEVSTRYPETTRLAQYGTSTEGRPLYGLVISSRNASISRPLIVLEAGIHAREWIAPAFALFIIEQLLENPSYSYMVEAVDWWIAPVMNPDGYEFTFTNTRLWRRTRSQGDICIGVDGNRNWNYFWLGSGSSSQECSDIYAGPEPFSEPETRTLAEAFLRYRNSTKLYLSVHSHGNMLMYPWSYTDERPDNYEELDALATAAAAAIEAVNGTTYRVGQIPDILYFASGSSLDWFKGYAGIDLGFVYELPGGGNFGFDLPAERIQSVVNETWPSIVVFYDYIVENFGHTE